MLIVLVRIALSTVRLGLYKLAYGSRLRLRFWRVFLGAQSVIDLTRGAGSVILKGRLVMRRSVLLKSSGGVITIGANCFMNVGVLLSSHKSILIGNDVLIGDGVRIYDHDHIFGPDVHVASHGTVSAPVVVGNNVWIGSGAILLKGTRIGDNCVVAAGTIVRGDIPANSLVRQESRMVITPIDRRNDSMNSRIEVDVDNGE